jgi:hypothetical protein
VGTAVSRLWCLYLFVTVVFDVVSLICTKKIFIANQRQGKGEGECGRTSLRKIRNEIYDSARFNKAGNVNEIQRFARIPQTTRD